MGLATPPLTRTHVEIYGASGAVQLLVEEPGTLYTDNTGLVTATAILKTPRELWETGNMALSGDGGGNIYSPHPVFKFIGMESREMSFKGPWAIAKCKYAGIDTAFTSNGTPPQYELVVGVSESPIATHPDFASDIGGNAVSPINGANFRHVKLGTIASESSPSLTNAFFVFDSFDLWYSGDINELAGVTSYLEANLTFRKSWKMDHFPNASDISAVGSRATPPSPCPSAPGGTELAKHGPNLLAPEGICLLLAGGMEDVWSSWLEH